MKKVALISWIVKFVMGGIALGIGIWYLTSSIGGAALTYTSMDTFLGAIGAGDGNIANTNGCFLCEYLYKLFGTIETATASFWENILDALLILIALGFGIYILYTGVAHVWDATKKTAGGKVEEKKIEFKPWFDKIWKQGIRVIIVSVLLGGAAAGGVATLQAITNVIMTPTLYLGGILGMAASGIADSATCAMPAADTTTLLLSMTGPFMCVIGNINSVILAGAAGGFAMMNYAWLGMGGGIITWVAGLALVIMFLVIGFDLFFQILSVVFKLIFLIIFLPVFVAAFAFEGGWKLASGLLDNGVKMIVNAAIKTVVIALKTVIIYAAVSYTADTYFPAPLDGYSATLPPMLQQTHTTQSVAAMPYVKECEQVALVNGTINRERYQSCIDEKVSEYNLSTENRQTLSVMHVFSKCESDSKIDGIVDKDRFMACYDRESAIVKQTYPHAFDFLDNGWDFILMMGMLFLLYMTVLRNKIEKLLPPLGKEDFDFGGELKNLGKSIWSLPKQIGGKIGKAIDEKAI